MGAATTLEQSRVVYFYTGAQPAVGIEPTTSHFVGVALYPLSYSHGAKLQVRDCGLLDEFQICGNYLSSSSFFFASSLL